MRQPSEPETTTSHETAARRRPSRGWYLLALVIVLVTAGVFVAAVMRGQVQAWSAIEAMPRFVAPTGPAGFTVELTEPGDYVVYYEDRGTLDGQTFDTPRQQVWTTPTRPSMTCRVTPADDETETDEDAIAVRLLGQTGATPAALDADRDTSVIYGRADGTGRHGVGTWTFTIDRPGRYTVHAAYDPAVLLDPAGVEVKPALTRDQQAQMRFEDVERYEQDRADAVARRALAGLEPEPVLLAVGPADPTGRSYFNVAGLKGAAALLAFGLTAGTIIALVTLMLRTGSVTQRGTMAQVRRGSLSR